MYWLKETFATSNLCLLLTVGSISPKGIFFQLRQKIEFLWQILKTEKIAFLLLRARDRYYYIHHELFARGA